MKLFKHLFSLLFIICDKIFRFFIKRPIISLLLIFGLWVNYLPLPDEKIDIVNDNPVTISGQNHQSDLDAEYKALVGSGETILAADFVDEALIKAWKTEDSPRKKFNTVFHRDLEQGFPDWKNRINYQQNRAEPYKSGMKKKTELKKRRIKDNSKFYTKEELDAMNYFDGTGFYKQQQDPNVGFNIYDTRQSFLVKMHDAVQLKKFLNSFNNKTN